MAKIQNRGYDFSPLLIWVRKAHLKSSTYALTIPEGRHFFSVILLLNQLNIQAGKD